MDIFVIELKSADNIETSLLEQYKKKEFSDGGKYKDHCFCYLMADRILKNFYGLKDAEVILSDKKPQIENSKKYLSISHSGEYAVIAFSDTQCGVDIEEMKNRDFVSISKRMGFSSATQEEFYFDWTKYEAEYKLAVSCKSEYSFRYENYAVTCLSENQNEEFQLYFQTGNVFPNLAG